MGFGSIFTATRGSKGIDVGPAKDELRQLYEKAAGQFTPYSDAGKEALTGYNALLRDPSSVTATPGYNFRLKSGADVLTNNALARGDFFSGNTGKALTEYGQNYATDEYNNALQRYLPMLSLGFGGASGTAKAYEGEGSGLANLTLEGAKSAEAAKNRRAAAWGDVFDSGLGFAYGRLG